MAETIRGLSLGLGLDTAGIDQGLKSLKGKLKLVSSEMAANMSAFDRGEKSVNKYQTQLTGLNRKLDVQKAAVNAARTEYERMVAQHGEGSRQAERAATAYNREVAAVNNLERYVEDLTEEFRNFQEEQEIANSTMGRLGTTLEQTGGKFSKFGDGMQKVGGGMSKFITAPILGLGAGMMAAASSAEDSSVRIQNTLGITAEEAQKLKEVSKGLYKDGFGESLEEVDTALLQTKQNMKDLSETDLAAATKSALVLADTFDADVNEVTRAGNNLMKGFGIESEEAFDLMAHGAQNGLNFSNEMFDNLSEYSTLFGNMGFSAEEYFQLLQQGTEAGVYNLDYINDVMKEFQIRVKDGSKASTDAMAQLSDETNGVWQAFLKGNATVKDVSNAVLGELEGMDDQVKANEIGVGLYGTKWEDLEADAMYALGGINGELENVSGSVDEMGQNLEESFSQRLSAIWRESKSALVPFGAVLLDFAEGILPKVSSGIEKVSNWLTNMSPETQKNIIVFGGLAAAAGPLIAGLGFVASGVGSIVTLVGSAATAISIMGTGVAASTPLIGGLASAFTILTGPIGIAAAAIAGIGVAGGLLVNHLRKDAIPEIDRFGDGVSENTKQALGSFFELSDGAGQSLMEMKINSTEVTDELATEMVGKYQSMNDQILTAMNERHAEQLEKTKTFFANSSVLTNEEEQKIMQDQEERNKKERETQQRQMDKIDEIYRTAAKENRETTQQENDIIDRINQQMQEKAVEHLSNGEVEQKIILERMKETAGDLSTKQAAEVIKNSAKQREGTIAEAEKEYSGRMAEIIRMRDETGEITEQQATDMIAEAKRSRDGTVMHAENMHEEVVDEAKAQSGDQLEEVNLTTGELLSKWEMYKQGVLERFRTTNEESLADFKRWGGNLKEWAIDAKDKVLETFDNMVEGAKKLPGRIGEGIGAMAGEVKVGVNKVANSLASTLGKGVNGVIDGINWVLDKIGVNKKSFIKNWEVPEYAHGTKGHPGGLAVLGDGRGSNAGRELVQTPNGELSLSPSKDTLVNLPKGSQVLSAKKTKELLGGLPKYANGIGDTLGNLWQGAKNLGGKAFNVAFNIWDYMKNPNQLMNVALRSLGISAPAGGTFVGDMARGGFNKVKNRAIQYIEGKLSDFLAAQSAVSLTGGNGGGFGPPFRFTSGPGPRNTGIPGASTYHKGWDWAAPTGTPIPSVSDGVVSRTGYNGISGNFIEIRSGNKIHRYQHNTRNALSVGQPVSKGQTVGFVGSTGVSSGPHLHYEVKGFANGGLITKPQLAMVGEGGHEEIIIPVGDKSRRTDAMKLLALAGKKLSGSGNNSVSPSQLPNATSGGTSRMEKLLEQMISLLSENAGVQQTVNYNVPVNSPSETARRNKQALVELGKGLI